MHTIYKITNRLNGHIYIGKHSCKCEKCSYMGSGKRIKAAIKKHGVENFSKEILFEFDSSNMMDDKEKELVTEEFCLRSDTYNLCAGGIGGWSFVNRTGLNDRTGSKHSYETKHKIKVKKTGFIVSEETRCKISEANKLTNKARGLKVSEKLKGKPKSEEHRRKIAESLRNRNKDAGML